MSHVIGKPNDRREVEVWRDAKKVFHAPLRELHQTWDETSWRIARCATTRRAPMPNMTRQAATTTRACICA